GGIVPLAAWAGERRVGAGPTIGHYRGIRAVHRGEGRAVVLHRPVVAVQRQAHDQLGRRHRLGVIVEGGADVEEIATVGVAGQRRHRAGDVRTGRVVVVGHDQDAVVDLAERGHVV